MNGGGKLLAAIDNSASAGPVLTVARAVGELIGAGVEAVHVKEEPDGGAEDVARSAGMAVRVLEGPVEEAVLAAARAEDVRTIALGIRSSSAGAMPAGHVALHVASRLDRPVVLVPPDVGQGYRLRKVLVPMQADRAASVTLRRTIRLAEGAHLEVVVLNVTDAFSLPAFEDQSQHETEAWIREFLCRWVPVDPRDIRFELRIGSPPAMILRVAAEVPADLIAIGWGRDLSPGRGAVVRAVLEGSRCPVVLLPVLGLGSRDPAEARIGVDAQRF